jgi:hypothetical protein
MASGVVLSTSEPPFAIKSASNAFSLAVTEQKLNGHVARGHDLVHGRLKAKTGQLFEVKGGGVRRVVGEEQYALAVLAEIFDKADRIGKYLIAKVDRAVHIKDVKLFVV